MTAIAVEEIHDWGSAMIVGVPGDQVEHLRASIRAARASRAQRCGTRLHNEVVHAWLEGALEPERRAVVDAEAMKVIEQIAAGESSGSEPRLIDWRTWG